MVAESKDASVVRMWDLKTRSAVFDSGKPQNGHEAPKFRAHAFIFSGDGSLLAVLGTEGWESNTVRLWDLVNEGKTWRHDGNNSGIGHIALSPDGRFLAEYHKDKIRLRETATGKLMRTLNFTPEGCMALHFSPDGKALVGYSYETTQVWKMPQGEAWLSLPRSTAVVHAPDGQSFAALYPESLAVFSAATGKELW